MVRTGKPSRGCAVCRRRRIKCDEKDPACSYCIKTKQQCPGYRDMFDLAWRDQTEIAKKHVERRNKPRSRQRHDSEVDEMTSLNYNTDMLKFTRPGFSLSDRPEDLALDFFFRTYVVPPNDAFVTRGWFESIAPMFLKSNPDSVLKTSTMAVAGALLVAWLDRPPDNPLSRSNYQRALAVMRERVAHKQVDSDEVLVSVLLLQMFEVMNGISKRQASPTTHLEGAVALVRHRGLNSFRSRLSRELLFEIRSQLITEAFRVAKPLPPDITTWSEQLQDADVPPHFRLDGINVHLANLNAWVMKSGMTYGSEASVCAFPSEDLEMVPRTIPNSFIPEKPRQGATPSYQFASVEALLWQSRTINQRLLSWSQTLPEEWSPCPVTGDECIPPSIKERGGLYQNWCHVYPSTSVANTWNKFRIASIRAQTVLLALLWQQAQLHLSATDGTNNPIQNDATLDMYAIKIEKDLAISIIQTHIDGICASVPFYLGSRVRAGRMGDRSVDYPHLPNIPVPDDHYQAAPAMAGWQLLGLLGYLMGVKDGMGMRPGQKMWIGGQMARIATIYNLGKFPR